MRDHDWCEAARKRNTFTNTNGGMYNDSILSHVKNPEEKPVFEHVMPENDSKPHIPERYCECIPYADADCPTVIIHPAYDGRELKEHFRKLGYC